MATEILVGRIFGKNSQDALRKAKHDKYYTVTRVKLDDVNSYGEKIYKIYGYLKPEYR
jgi:hypothetical protein